MSSKGLPKKEKKSRLGDHPFKHERQGNENDFKELIKPFKSVTQKEREKDNVSVTQKGYPKNDKKELPKNLEGWTIQKEYREIKGKEYGPYLYAYRKIKGKLHKIYVGKESEF